MQEFEIKGKTFVTAELKAQIDDSPVAIPAKKGTSDDYILPFEEALKDATSTVSINNSIIKELGTVLPQITSGFHALNDIVNKTAQNTNTLNQLKKPEIQNQQILPAQEGLNPENMQPLVDAVDNTTDSYKTNNAILKEFSDIMPELLKNVEGMNDAVSNTNKNLPSISHVNKPEISKDNKLKMFDDISRQNFMQLLNTGSNAVQSVANGNVVGGIVGGINTVASTANNASKLAAMEGMAGLAKGLIAGGVVAAAGALVVKGADTLASKFLEEAPTIYGTGKAFGSTNDSEALRSYSRLNYFNRGTGLDVGEFQNISQLLRKQGVGNNAIDKESTVGDIARTTARWAYATGGDASQYAELAGVMSRYGGSKNVSEDFNRIVTAGYASGLQDTQIPEFLSGIRKVMEDGIAKGFERSATEVADTLLMFSKMSGNNAFWQGEQGARLLNQVNSGIAGATALSKTEDILVYRAMANAYQGTVQDEKGNVISKIQQALGDTYIEGGGYLNIMQLIEKGVNAENFDDIKKALDDAYGDNTVDKIEALRKMTGLNYNGAARLYNLDAENITDTDIKNVMTSPDNQNKETRYQEAMNDIKTAVVRIGSGAAELKIKSMELVSNNVQRIADKVARYAIDTSVSFGETAENSKLVKSIGKAADDALYGSKGSQTDWLDVTRIDRNDTTAINEFVRLGDFGEWIKQLAGGDEGKANEFLEAVFDDNNKKNKKVSQLKGKVEDVTADGIVYMVDERAKVGEDSIKGILQELYNLFKDGKLTIRESR